MEIKDELKKIRNSTGLTQKEFAELFKLPLRTYTNWEQGNRTPPEYIPQMIKQILNYYRLGGPVEKDLEEEINRIAEKYNISKEDRERLYCLIK